MRRRQYNESKDGGNGFLGLGRKDRGDSPKFKKSTARLSEVDGGAPLDEVVVSADAPRWLKYQRQYETDNPKEDFLRKNITNFDRKFGNSERNYPKRMDRQYNKRTNDYVAEQLRAEYESKNGTRDNSRLRTAEERLKLYDYYNDKEREILKNSKISSWYLPAERQHRIRVSDNPDDYLTESFIKTDSQGNDVFDSESGNRKGYQRLSNQLEGTPERFRVFSNAQNDIEDYVNPGIWLGNMARNLGQAPYKAMKTGSALPILGAIAEPLLSGIPLNTAGKAAKKAAGENRVDIISSIIGNLRKEIDPMFKEPRKTALDWANKTQDKYYSSPEFLKRLENIQSEQKREFSKKFSESVKNRDFGLMLDVMDPSDMSDFYLHDVRPHEKWDKIKTNAESRKYLTFFESKKNRLKNIINNEEDPLSYNMGFKKGRAQGISGYRLDSNLDPHVRHNLVDKYVSPDNIRTTAFHEGNHGLTDSNFLLNKQTRDFLQSPFDLSGVLPRSNNTFPNRKSYILNPTEIYARLQELRLGQTFGDFRGLDEFDKINLKNRRYGPTDNHGNSTIDPIFWNSIKDWDKFYEVMNKMPSVVGAGLGLKALQQDNPQQFKKGGVVGGPDTPDPFNTAALYKSEPLKKRSYEITDYNATTTGQERGKSQADNITFLKDLVKKQKEETVVIINNIKNNDKALETIGHYFDIGRFDMYPSLKQTLLNDVEKGAGKEDLLKRISDYDFEKSGDLGIFMEVSYENGLPDIRAKKPIPFASKRFKNAPNYSEVDNALNVGRATTVIPELAHAQQSKEYGPLRMIFQTPYDLVRSIDKHNFEPDLLNIFQDKEHPSRFQLPNWQDTYSMPGTLEHDAHSVREQGIRDSIQNKYNRKIGQFKKGGFVDGGDDPKPIYVTDPNDPKLKSYQDSLSLYNNYKELKTALSKANYEEAKDIISNNPNTIYKLLDDDKNRSILNKGLQFVLTGTTQAVDNRKETPTLRSVDDFIHGQVNKNLPRQLYSETIKPTGTRTFRYAEPDPYIARRDLIGDLRVIAEYDNVKPKQPVLLTKKESNDNSLVWYDEKGKGWQQVDPKGFNYKLNPKVNSSVSNPVHEQPKRYGKKIDQIPTLNSEIKYSRNTDIPTTTYNTSQSKYQDGVLKQDFKGVPGVQVWSKRDKETGTLRPVALVNSAGESIDYNKYKDGAFPEGFQHPKKYADGGFINNNMTDPNNYLMAMLTRLQNGRTDSIVPPIPSLPIKPIDPTIKPNWPPGNEVPNNPDQPYRPKVSQPQSIAPRPVNPLTIPSRTQDVPNTDNVQYNLPNNNPKPKDPLLGGLLVGAGAAGGTMANIGRPDVGLGTLSGVATGAGYGAMLGPVGAAVGGILGGIGGFASTGLNRTRYDEANAEAQKGKIKAATIYGGDVGSFEFGGNVYSADGEEIVPIQTEKGEKIVSPEGYIYTSKAKQLHKHMDNDLVTDILPSGSYVASNSRAMQILRDKANKMVMGYDTVEYLEGGGSPIPKEHTLGEIMGKKKMTPAEILDIVKNKFPTNQIEYDQFAQKANVLNLKSRLPYINAVISAAKK